LEQTQELPNRLGVIYRYAKQSNITSDPTGACSEWVVGKVTVLEIGICIMLKIFKEDALGILGVICGNNKMKSSKKQNFECDLDAIKTHAEKHVSFIDKFRIIDLKIARLKKEKKRMLAELKKGMGEILIK
jgi:hypothetical protein